MRTHTRIFMFLATILVVPSFAQQREEAEKLVEEGVAYHDKGDYEGAIARYDKALELDKDNLLAMVEKAMTLQAMQKHNETLELCRETIEKHPGDENLNTLYVTYGNAYDALKMTDKSIEIYDEGIRQFPGFYHLYYNKGITLVSAKKNNEAISCFQRSAILNPRHASSHNALARLHDNRKTSIPAFLSYCRFLVVEPQGRRAKENLDRLKEIITANVEKTGKNSITVNVSPDQLPDSTKEKAVENDFRATQLSLAMSAAIRYNKKFRKMNEAELFAMQLDWVCGSLKEHLSGSSGFFWEYYAPYFIEMKDQSLTRIFSYIAFATSDDSEVKKWLETHEKEIDQFYEWSGNFNWKSQ